MNKRQRKKTVMRNVSRLYDMAFERERFRRDIAIICGRGARGQRTLTTMMVKSQRYEFSGVPFETMGISLEGYAVDRKVI